MTETENKAERPLISVADLSRLDGRGQLSQKAAAMIMAKGLAAEIARNRGAWNAAALKYVKDGGISTGIQTAFQPLLVDAIKTLVDPPGTREPTKEPPQTTTQEPPHTIEFGEGEGAVHFQFDWEGRKRPRSELQRMSYWLLGTGAHPDAAIVEPFRLAIEYDVQSASGEGAGWSKLKQCLGKTLFHVLSGAYDAALQIYILRGKPDLKVPHSRLVYGVDRDPASLQKRQKMQDEWGPGGVAYQHTDVLLDHLTGMGVHIALLGGADEEQENAAAVS